MTFGPLKAVLKSLAAGAFALAVTGLICASSAQAHGEASPLVRGVVDRVEPEVPQVSFAVVRGPAALVQVTNRSSRPLEIISIDGKPFLRVGPRGVEANLAERAWFESGNPDGVATARPKRGAATRWKLVSSRPTWSYFEHRLHPREAELPQVVLSARKTVRLDDFNIPIRYDGKPGRVQGHLEFQPVVGAPVPRVISGNQMPPGVAVTALAGRFPGVFLSNTSRRTITVLGADGEPYLRIGPAGVAVNQRSPIHIQTLKQTGKASKVVEDPGARALWVRQSASPTFGWTDPRVRYVPELPPGDIAERGVRSQLKTWTIPIRVGAKTVNVEGATDWVPTNTAGLPGKGNPLTKQGFSATTALYLVPIVLLVAVALVGRRRLAD